MDALASAMYDDARWPDLADGLAEAVAMAASLGTAELVTWGAGHGAVGRSDCVNKHVADYLVKLTVPSPQTRCPA